MMVLILFLMDFELKMVKFKVFECEYIVDEFNFEVVVGVVLINWGLLMFVWWICLLICL